jgi:hypothetical protein
MLERYRREARTPLVALKPAQPSQRVRRQPPQIKSHDAHVLRQRIVIPLDRLLGPGSPEPLSAEELSQRTRRALQTRATPPQPTREAAGPVVTTDDPFRDDPARPSAEEAAATAPPAAEPVSPPELEAEAGPEVEATTEAEEMPTSEETPGGEEDPFSDL